eukprot:6172747-Pleurochrysis_carterae.AAC.4
MQERGKAAQKIVVQQSRALHLEFQACPFGPRTLLACGLQTARLLIAPLLSQSKCNTGSCSDHFAFCCAISRRVASCSNSVSTSVAGNWTYLMTEPRTKQFLTDC